MAVAVRISDGEARFMPELLRRIVANGGYVKEWLGDIAYNSWYNIRAVEEIGATPFFDFKDNVTGKTRPDTVGRLYRRLNDDQDLYWERYGRRSLAESGMHAVKQRFGYSLSSRAKPAQFAEVMLLQAAGSANATCTRPPLPVPFSKAAATQPHSSRNP